MYEALKNFCYTNNQTFIVLVAQQNFVWGGIEQILRATTTFFFWIEQFNKKVKKFMSRIVKWIERI